MQLCVRSYKRRKLIGKGAYGSVYACEELYDNATLHNDSKCRPLAIKSFRQSDDESIGMSPSTLRELAILTQLSHPNIIQQLDVLKSGGNIELLMERGDMSLDAYMNAHTLDEPQRKLIMRQLLCAVTFIHERHIIHRDIKPSNIIVFNHEDHQKLNVKLADFGNARPFVKKHQPRSDERLTETTIPPKRDQDTQPVLTDHMTTPPYEAPEGIMFGFCYDERVDEWAIGCTFAEMYLMQTKATTYLFSEWKSNHLGQIFDLLGRPSNGDWKWHCLDIESNKAYKLCETKSPAADASKFRLQFAHVPSTALDLMLKLLSVDPSQRISSADALLHPFFTD